MNFRNFIYLKTEVRVGDNYYHFTIICKRPVIEHELRCMHGKITLDHGKITLDISR